MTELEYLDLAEAVLQAVESACDRINDETDADIDNQRTGGMVTLSFENRSQIIINLQKPLQEIWMAARAGGFHYKTPRARANFLPTCRATPASRPAGPCVSVLEQVQDTTAFIGRRHHLDGWRCPRQGRVAGVNR